MTAVSSLGMLKTVIMTVFNISRDEKAGTMTTFPFKWQSCRQGYFSVDILSCAGEMII